jgi:hypothetical protein
MKRIFLYTIAIIALFIGACKKDSSSTSSSTDPNKVSVSISKVNTPITNYGPGGYQAYITLAGGKIFFGNESNTTVPQFLISYDISANIFSGNLATTNNICGCGYESTLTSDGTSLYFVANDATRYDVTSNSWQSFPYPAIAQTGESAVAYYNNKIYFAAGRNNGHIFNYYDIKANNWYTLPDMPYDAPGYPSMVGWNNKLFIMGGNGVKNMASFNLATNAWTQLKNPPFDYFINYLDQILAAYKNFIITLQINNGTAIYVYSPINDTWATKAITLPALNGIQSLTLLADGDQLYIAGVNNNEFVLYKVNVTVN